jgi:NitT/TauT family transport system substrate-binding protein
MIRVFSAIIVMLALSTAMMGCTQEGDAVYTVRLSPPDMIEQLKLKQIDGYVAWEPFVSKGVKSGGKILLSSNEIWNSHPCCVVAYSEDFSDDRAVRDVVWAHIKATEFINRPENREKVIEYAAEFTGLSRETVSKALDNIKFIEYPEEEKFRTYFRFLGDSKLLKKSINELGFNNEDEFFSSFFRRDIYEEVKKELEKNPNYVPDKYDGSIRIGYLTADLHHLALFVAQKEGYFEEIGMKNIVFKQYPNGVAVMDAFRAGEIDIAYLGGAPATLKRVNDDTKIRIVAGVNNEGSAIVVREGINSIKDLRGKTIAIPGYGTVQDFLLRMVAEKEGLKVVAK